MADKFTPLPIKGLKSNNTTPVTNDNISTLSSIASNMPPSYTEGNEVKLSSDLEGSLRVVDKSTVTTGGSTGTNATAIAGAVTTNSPTYTSGTTNNISLTTAGAVRVDSSATTQPVSKNTNPNSVTNAIFTQLTDGTSAVGTSVNPLYVLTDSVPGTPKFTTLSTTDTAAGAQATLSGVAISNGTIGYLSQVTVSSSVRYKAIIQSFDGTAATTLAVLFGEANTTEKFVPSDTKMFTRSGNGTTNLFRVLLTNLDNAFAADLYTTIEWTEI